MKQKISVVVIFFVSIALVVFFYIKNNKKSEFKIKQEEIHKIEERSYSSNIIENVKYSSKDINNNEYIISAKEGEIDLKNSSVIFLKGVTATIILNDKNDIKISSNFGKYNINNFDTIFSENVIINYLQNEINGEYLDFSIQRNSMIISKNVIYKNSDNILKTDVIEVNLKTRDTKLFMYNKENKVSLLNQN